MVICVPPLDYQSTCGLIDAFATRLFFAMLRKGFVAVRVIRSLIGIE
jgi:hypothetical protein